MKGLASLLLLVLPLALFGARLHPERYYQERWAADHGGECEVQMPDGTRCDILTETHAIEVDFADKWAEAVGQCLLYSMHTDREAGIVLIVEHRNDLRYLERLEAVIEEYDLPIEVWVFEEGNLSPQPAFPSGSRELGQKNQGKKPDLDAFLVS